MNFSIRISVFYFLKHRKKYAVEKIKKKSSILRLILEPKGYPWFTGANHGSIFENLNQFPLFPANGGCK